MSNGTNGIEVEEKVSKFQALPDLRNPSQYDYVYCNVPNGASPVANGKIGDLSEYVLFPWQAKAASEKMKKMKKLANSSKTKIEQISKMIQKITGIKVKPEKDMIIAYYKKLGEVKREKFPELIKNIAKLGIRGRELFKEPIHYLAELRADVESSSVTLSQEQCACLLAHCFFCTFSGPKDERFHFRYFFDDTETTKPRFIFNYFETYFDTHPSGVISFRRVRATPEEWAKSSEKFTRLEITDKNIEDCENCLQVDFANQMIGGGVLHMGYLQEEIRFLMCPEMIVSLLFVKQMAHNEAVFIVGAQRYSSYTGYGHTTEFRPFTGKLENRDEFGRLENELVAIDAYDFSFSNTSLQFQKDLIDRELLKLKAGFATTLETKRRVATGNWGCGAFRGDPKLKSLLQLIAAAKAGRDVVYCHFSNENFAKELSCVYELLIEKEITVGELYNQLVKDAGYDGNIFDDVTEAFSEMHF